jgi:DNA-binding transcriptional MerR regulator
MAKLVRLLPTQKHPDDQTTSGEAKVSCQRLQEQIHEMLERREELARE